jgi:hypothetical protein
MITLEDCMAKSGDPEELKTMIANAQVRPGGAAPVAPARGGP